MLEKNIEKIGTAIDQENIDDGSLSYCVYLGKNKANNLFWVIFY